jgi:hypothetical protein
MAVSAGNDARRIAQMMRVGFYRPAHKTLRSQKLRMLLTVLDGHGLRFQQIAMAALRANEFV